LAKYMAMMLGLANFAEELLAERGIEVDHTTLFRWVARFTPLFTEAARPLGTPPGIAGVLTRRR
jgi:transposase-like protein